MKKTTAQGQRKPRQARPLKNPINMALLSATRLTEAEIEHSMQAIRRCLAMLREGQATSDQVDVLDTSIGISQAIEDSRIMHGLSEPIAAAQGALQTIRQRATRTGAWQPTACWAAELDAVTVGIGWHKAQLRQLSAGELHQIIHKFINTAKSQGRTAIRIQNKEWLMDEAMQNALAMGQRTGVHHE